MNHAELQYLARVRLRDARSLLAARRWSAAYYLAGYAVECGLKACIITSLRKSDQFPDKRYSEQCWTHNLVQLLALAGLKAALTADCDADPKLFANWDTVSEWSETTRYARVAKRRAEDLYAAIADKTHGLYPWIKAHW